MMYLVLLKADKEVESIDVSQMEMKDIFEKGMSWKNQFEENDFIISPDPGDDSHQRFKLGQQISDIRSLKGYSCYSPSPKKK